MKKHLDIVILTLANFGSWLLTDANAEQIMRNILLILSIPYALYKMVVITRDAYRYLKKRFGK